MKLKFQFFLLSTLLLLQTEVPSQEQPLLKLNHSKQVKEGLQHWNGAKDASFIFSIEIKDKDLLIYGTLKDDYPFFQPRKTKIMPPWWKIPYGADGLRFKIYTIEKNKNQSFSLKIKTDFYLDFGSQAMNPKIVILQSEVTKNNTLDQFQLKFTRGTIENQLWFQLPVQQLLSENTQARPLVLEVIQYDLDGRDDDYTILKDRFRFNQPENNK